MTKPLLWASPVICHLGAGLYWDMLDLRDREPIYDFVKGGKIEVDVLADVPYSIGLGLFPSARSPKLLGVKWVNLPSVLAGDTIELRWRVDCVTLPNDATMTGRALRAAMTPEFQRAFARGMRQSVKAIVTPWSEAKCP